MSQPSLSSSWLSQHCKSQATSSQAWAVSLSNDDFADVDASFQADFLHQPRKTGEEQEHADFLPTFFSKNEIPDTLETAEKDTLHYMSGKTIR